MTCEEINFILDATPTGIVTPAQRQSIDAHFASCRACREAWDDYHELAAMPVPAPPRDLQARIFTALAANRPAPRRAGRRSLVIGSILVVGAAAAATVMLQLRQPPTAPVNDRVEPVSGAAPISSTAPVSLAPPAAATDDVGRADFGTDSGDSTQIATQSSLDPHSIAVVPVTDLKVSPAISMNFSMCHESILEHLRSVGGLNVISGGQVAAFANTASSPREIARQLGAGSVLTLKLIDDPNACAAILYDTDTGAILTGAMPSVGPNWPAEGWTHFGEHIANQTRDALLKDRSTLIAEARATVLNSELDDLRRAAAFFNLRRVMHLTKNEYAENVIAAAAQIGMSSSNPNARKSAWLGVAGITDPSLIQPLLYSVTNDADEKVLRAAAIALHPFIDELAVRAALTRLAADNPLDFEGGKCCMQTASGAARRALRSDDQLLDAAWKTMEDESLPAAERLRPLSISPDGRGLLNRSPDGRKVYLQLSAEAAQAIFDIGSQTKDVDIRSQAWAALGNSHIHNPDFIQTFIDDLSDDASSDTVRAAAVGGLRRYLDAPGVRAALEKAKNDASAKVRDAAKYALEGPPPIR